MDGIILIDKPKDITSHQVVSRLRSLFPGAKAGHTGTLDPMATGVLPICLGKATRVAEYIIELPKIYRAGITFGMVSDTEDITGTLEVQEGVKMPEMEVVAGIIDTFTGEIEQTPPYYSAVKYRGKPMYHWIRQGKQVPRGKRLVKVYEMKLINYDRKHEPHLTLEISCSKGTYVRTLAADIGRIAGCGAVLSELRRLRVGPYGIENAFTLDMVEKKVNTGSYEQLLQPIDSALDQFPFLKLDESQIEGLKNGLFIPIEISILPVADSFAKPIRFYDLKGDFKGLATLINNKGITCLKTLKYLARDEKQKGEQ